MHYGKIVVRPMPDDAMVLLTRHRGTAIVYSPLSQDGMNDVAKKHGLVTGADGSLVFAKSAVSSNRFYNIIDDEIGGSSKKFKPLVTRNREDQREVGYAIMADSSTLWKTDDVFSDLDVLDQAYRALGMGRYSPQALVERGTAVQAFMRELPQNRVEELMVDGQRFDGYAIPGHGLSDFIEPAWDRGYATFISPKPVDIRPFMRRKSVGVKLNSFKSVVPQIDAPGRYIFNTRNLGVAEGAQGVIEAHLKSSGHMVYHILLKKKGGTGSFTLKNNGIDYIE
ncbi:MAG: hypothetical protein HY366_00255 [Candidatus Aenigmarchaeota archaeon]|nr:hypothetical protein [Candidatus Aenigmarchaeota archaeon]